MNNRSFSQNGFASLLKWAYSERKEFGESKFLLGVDAVKQVVFKGRPLSRWRLAYKKQTEITKVVPRGGNDDKIYHVYS